MKSTMNRELFERLEQAESEQQLTELQQEVTQGGYSSFYQLQEHFHERVRHFTQDEAQHVLALIDKARQLFPVPAKFSPSWQSIWTELEQTTRLKLKVFETIPAGERDGEWQIVMDNPIAIQQTACYPGLTFMEAAYMFGYFRPQLEKNEYIRLQKIQQLIMEFGT
ncbi:hypothetical protein [Paenibacillus thalictri]|nr:hypothetical protein [Paenibacillus thalictri]